MAGLDDNYKKGQFVSIAGKLAIATRKRLYKAACKECKEQRGKDTRRCFCDLKAASECTRKLGLNMYPKFIKKKTQNGKICKSSSQKR